MLTLLKYIIQLLLSPGNGWTDIAEKDPDPEILLRKGIYPLLCVAAATELLTIVYHETGFGHALIGAVDVVGSYFVSIFIARLLFDLYLDKIAGKEVDKRRSSTLIMCGIAMMIVIQIIENCLPWSVMIVRFLPLYAILVLSKGSTYLGIRKRNELQYTLFAGATVVAVPLIIYYLIYLLIQ